MLMQKKKKTTQRMAYTNGTRAEHQKNNIIL
jgi:hypothetical protein